MTTRSLFVSLACSLALVGACADVDTTDPTAPRLVSDEELVSLAASTAGDLPADVADPAARDGGFVGRFIKLAFGSYADMLERIGCLKLDMTTETIMFGDCAVTIQNTNCGTEWSASLGQYVCACDVTVTGASGSGC